MSLELLLRFEVWMIAGLSLVVLDMLVGLDFFALAFGVGALLTGITLLGARLAPIPFSDSWEAVVMLFGVLSVLVLIPLRQWLNKRRDGGGTDINSY